MSLLLFVDKIEGLKTAAKVGDCDDMKYTKDWQHWSKKTRNLMRGSMKRIKQ